MLSQIVPFFESYLNRVRVARAPVPSESGLRDLHLAQIFAIPFEGIAPFLGEIVAVDPESVSAKILGRGRGGYCFELNTLFGEALRAAGFRARPLLGRVINGRPGPRPRTHLINLVELGDREWIADVGFGGPGPVAPLPLEDGFETREFSRPLRLRRDEELGWRLETEGADGWWSVYAFDLGRVHFPDIEMSNHFSSTFARSAFRLNLRCALPGPEGLATLVDRKLVVSRAGEKRERTLASAADFSELFAREIPLPLTAAEIAAIDARLPAPSP